MKQNGTSVPLLAHEQIKPTTKKFFTIPPNNDKANELKLLIVYTTLNTR